LGELKQLSNERYVSPVDLALIHAGIGEPAQALYWLERACEQRCSQMALIAVDQRLDHLRHNGCFKNLMNRVGFQSLS